MKKLLASCLLASAVGMGSTFFAAFSISGDMTVGSEYVFRGIKLADNTFHPSVELGFDDLYVGIWGALPMENRSSEGYIDEWDVYAGYNFTISDNLGLDVGATYYYYPIDEADDTLEAYVGLNWDLEGWTPGIYGYYDFDLETWTLQASIGYSIPFEDAGTSLDLTATYGYVSPNEGDSYSYYGVDAVVPYQLNDSTAISAGVHWATHTIDDLEDNHFYFTLGVSFGG